MLRCPRSRNLAFHWPSRRHGFSIVSLVWWLRPRYMVYSNDWSRWPWRVHTSSSLVFSGARCARSYIFCVMLCLSLFVLFSFFFWSLYCLSFFDLRLVITPVLSSNSSCPFDLFFWSLCCQSFFALRLLNTFGIFKHFLNCISSDKMFNLSGWTPF
jgi:hypothetical protein